MKLILASALILAVPTLAIAQTAAPAKAAPAAAKPAAKPAAPKPVPARRAALKAVEEVTPIDDDPNIKLTEQDLEIAKRVYLGTIPCELGASVTITPSERRPGFFVVQTGKTRFRMHPVESRTGAIRLEDARAGAMWLQLGNKSMLMSQKMGQRLADECMSPDQVTFADELKRNPRPSILDAPVPAAAGAGTASAPPVTPAASAPR
ncbi:MAG: hypothetical protein Q7T70_07505 [Polaromonas sp.]|nr:hypothetical protein [Polaromonas sp.]